MNYTHAQLNIIVFPCFNEEKRIQAGQFLGFLAQNPDCFFIFVDDGSTDESIKMLQSMQKKMSDRMQVIELPKNQGKGEAVRQGLLAALERSNTIVGYADIDLATPLSELDRLRNKLENSKNAVLLGSRVKLLGRQIKRNEIRHYFGRLFATVASIVLRLGVYDTQCGAKFFKCSDALKKALEKPFISRWAFDVELLKRLLKSNMITAADIYEEPLNEWHDVSGSKINVLAMIKATLDLLRI